MPARVFPAPLLSLATSGLTGLESVDADNLSCMWTLFTKCAENLENGRRLENFSWRLWYREAHFFDDPSTTSATTQAFHFDRKSHPQPSPSPPDAMSDLSESVKSASDMDDLSEKSEQTACTIASSTTSSHRKDPRRQNVKHLSPDSFKCLIQSLEPPTTEAEKWKAMKAKRINGSTSPKAQPQNLPHPEPRATTTIVPAVPTDIPLSRPRTSSETQGSPASTLGRSLQRVSSSIVRGFTPEHPSISRRLAPLDDPQSQDEKQPREGRRKPQFFLAGSASESDDDYLAPRNLAAGVKPVVRSNISPPAMKRAASNGSVKKTHFHEIVDTKILSRDDDDDDEEEEEVGEDDDSAIVSDDDDEDWEDSQSDSDDPRDEKDLFAKREDRQPTSQSSMLSSLFKSKSDYHLPSQAFRAAAVAGGSNTLARTRASPAPTPRVQPLASSSPPPFDPVGRIPPQSALAQNTFHAQPIPASPRTTRRKMLASELSESLRRNLLWERQHRGVMTTAAALKRRHTSNDLARLKAYPEGVSGDRAEFFDSNDIVW